MNKSNKRRLRRIILWSGVFLLLAGAGVYGYQEWGDYNLFLNFDVVENGKLLRSGQPHIGDIKRIHQEFNLGTIFVVYGDEVWEIRDYAREHGIKVLGIYIPPGGVPDEKQVQLWFELMQGKKIRNKDYSEILTEWPLEDDKKMRFPFPVLIHCKAGSDRAGIMIALYRIKFHGWSIEEARQEMLRHGHLPLFNHKPFEFLDQYQG
jgi:protein-tyrosine phosphatase